MTLGRRPGVAGALVAAAPPWLISRAVVLGALALSHRLVDHTHPAAAGVVFRVHQGLLGWDAGFYQAIAGHGYAGQGEQALRFFPLFPMVARGLSWITPLTPGGAVLVVANAAALAAGTMLFILARRETDDDALARRAIWLLYLVPPAFVLTMGYSESLMLVCSVGTFIALRSGRFGWAAVGGLLAGLTRPVGVLLVLPAAVEACRGVVPWIHPCPLRATRAIAAGPGTDALTAPRVRDYMARGAAVLAPPAGLCAYLAWVGVRFGDAGLPLRLQEQAGRRGALVEPTQAIGHNVSTLLHGHAGGGLHVAWAVVMAALVVVAFRRWPASYAWFALASLAVALTSANLDSLERYGLAAFPLVLAAATLLRRRTLEEGVVVLATGGLAAYAVLAFMNQLVP